MRDLGRVACETFWGESIWKGWASQPDVTQDRWRSAAKAAVRELLDEAEGDDFVEMVHWLQVPSVPPAPGSILESTRRRDVQNVTPKVLAGLRKLADLPPSQDTPPADAPAAEPAPAESADSRQLLEHAKLTIQFLRSMATVTVPECMRVAMADRANCLEAAVEAFEKGTTT